MTEVRPARVYKFRSPPQVALGCLLAGPLTPALILFYIVLGLPDERNIFYLSVGLIVVPSSLGVAIATKLFERSASRTGDDLSWAIFQSGFIVISIYFLAWVIFLIWEGLVAEIDAVNYVASAFSTTAFLIGCAFVWAPIVAMLSYIPFRLLVVRPALADPSPPPASPGPPT